MRNNLVPYFVIGLILILVGCDNSGDEVTPEAPVEAERTDVVPSGFFKTIAYPAKVIQDFTFHIKGEIGGDITTVALYVENELIQSDQVTSKSFAFDYQFKIHGDQNVILKGYGDEQQLLADTLRPVTVLRHKTLAFQENDLVNKLGLWIWYLEETGFQSHQEVASKIADLGVKRAFIKVADGKSIWPEAKNVAYENNEAFLDYYHNAGMEVYAWSYNYPDHESQQAKALYQAAKSGYDGYVLDLEVEFDGKDEALDALLFAFYEQMMQAIDDGYIDDSFPLIVTTWGNPKDHDMGVSVIDQYVDAHMPQTYIEKWGGTWLENPEKTIYTGNAEYQSLGAQKPVFHIVSAENVAEEAIDPELLNRAVKHAGRQTSIWKIPGTNMGAGWENNWSILEQVEWNYEFKN